MAEDSYAAQRRAAMAAKASLLQELGMGDARAKVEATAAKVKSERKERSTSKARAKPDSAAFPKRRSSRVAGLAAASAGLPKQVRSRFER
jgi:hypothetical protein